MPIGLVSNDLTYRLHVAVSNPALVEVGDAAEDLLDDELRGALAQVSAWLVKDPLQHVAAHLLEHDQNLGDCGAVEHVLESDDGWVTDRQENADLVADALNAQCSVAVEARQIDHLKRQVSRISLRKLPEIRTFTATSVPVPRWRPV